VEVNIGSIEAVKENHLSENCGIGKKPRGGRFVREEGDEEQFIYESRESTDLKQL